MKVDSVEVSMQVPREKNKYAFLSLFLGLIGLFPCCGVPLALGGVITGVMGVLFALKNEIHKGLIISSIGFICSLFSLGAHGYAVVEWRQQLEDFIVDPPLLVEDAIKASLENDSVLLKEIFHESVRAELYLEMIGEKITDLYGVFQSVRIDEIAIQEGHSMEPIFEGSGAPQEFELEWPLIFNFSNSKDVFGFVRVLYEVKSMSFFGMEYEAKVMEIAIGEEEDRMHFPDKMLGGKVSP